MTRPFYSELSVHPVQPFHRYTDLLPVSCCSAVTFRLVLSEVDRAGPCSKQLSISLLYRRVNQRVDDGRTPGATLAMPLYSVSLILFASRNESCNTYS